MGGGRGRDIWVMQVRKWHNYIRVLSASNTFHPDFNKAAKLPITYKYNFYHLLNFLMDSSVPYTD